MTDTRLTTDSSAPGIRLVARDRHVAILIAVVGVLLQLPGLLWNPPDGKAINNALRILNGDVPYRDFWTMYAPGHFYLIAILFKLFGVQVWVQGLAHQIIVATVAAFLFLLTRRLELPRVPACLVAVAFVGMLWTYAPSISSYEPALLFLVPAVDRAIAFSQGKSASALIAAGVLCGIGAWFKHDVAFYVAFGIVAGLSASWFLAADRRPVHWVSPPGVLLRVGGGAVVSLLPVVSFLALKARSDAWRDLIVFPATDFAVVRGEGYPPLFRPWRRVAEWIADPFDAARAYQTVNTLGDWTASYMPLAVFVAGVIVLLRHRRLDPSAVAVAAISLATLPLFAASAYVQHNTNSTSLWILAVILGTIAWASARPRVWASSLLACLFVIHTGALLVDPVLQTARSLYRTQSYETLDFPGTTGVRMSRSRFTFTYPIVAFIREHVPEDEPIYVGLVRHDAVVISNQSFYYLSGRRVASRYNELHPGVVDREDIQREIIADLERLKVRCAVLWDFGWSKAVMNDILAARRRQIPEIGATVLDEYLARNFEQIGRFGEFVLVWRKGVDMPPPPKPAPRQVGALPRSPRTSGN
ncbi:MAG: ArnT family glycosyltransferase [Vicinamibacterales bacterium]